MSCRAYNTVARLLAALLLAPLLVACGVSQQRLGTEQILADANPIQHDTTIALLGSTGMVGGHILREALARGYRIRALARTPAKLAYLGERIEVVAGDARDPAAVSRLLQGSDAAISAIGPVKGDDGRSDLTTVTSRNIAAAAATQRYIVVSGAGVVTPRDQRDIRGWWIRQLARLRYQALLQDRQAEYEFLADSSLDWTLLRCPLIESATAQGSARASLDTPGGFTLRAGELAAFVFDELERGQYLCSAPFLSSP